MNVENRVYPDRTQREELARPGPDGPIVMVNLLKFRERAQYPDGRDPDISGRAAYERYGRLFVPLLHGIGGRVIYSGAVNSLSLGVVETLWDEVALAEYPSRTVFWQLTATPEYAEIAVHRQAGLEGQLNIETVRGAIGPARA
ncbi:DUF1330 domain-containing protein [Candidatus Binatia bacterium]|jgi:uncharacterized protein (DUF1330 family)|nr:DUF1330 domain-containing protein [Candidatus Binatia bacterium]